jgi:hypothetical protein
MEQKLQRQIQALWRCREPEGTTVHLAKPGSAGLLEGVHRFETVAREYLRMQVIPDEEEVAEGDYCTSCTHLLGQPTGRMVIPNPQYL